MQTGFKYIDRNKKRTMVLVPGWATDHRIFDFLDIDFNYLLPTLCYPRDFETELLNALREYKLEKVSILGFSMGGFVSAKFAARHAGLIETLIFVGIRRRFRTDKIEEIRGLLLKNKRAFLYKFYLECFAGKESLMLFKRTFLKSYCEEMEIDHLLMTLDYLKSAEIEPETLLGIKSIKIIHGEEDKIAPLNEANWIRERLPKAEFIALKGEGHIPFLNKEFSKSIW
ncbi:MAG: alpha/beta hydrolase [Candidatus Omnitrophota bacterium]